MNDSDSKPLPPGKLPQATLDALLKANPVLDPSVVVGPGVGKDAAVVDIGGNLVAIKSDPITFAVDKAATYLVNVNANDLACLGAQPKWLLVTALLPAGIATLASVNEQFEELQDACATLGVSLIGGHTEVTIGIDRTLLIGTMIGVSSANNLMTPGAAKPGDRLLLTKGIAIEGTLALAREFGDRLVGVDPALIASAIDFLVDPGISIVPEASLLARLAGVTALHDPTEGGLATAVRELAAVSSCGAVVSRQNVPVLPETEAICAFLGIDPLGLLSSGALLAAVEPVAMASVEELLGDNAIQYSWIGKLTPSPETFQIVENGEIAELPSFDSDEITRVPDLLTRNSL